MKKFMAIVMCLAMALSMMTVVSFAAGEKVSVDFGADITAEAGEALSIPVNFKWLDSAAAETILLVNFKLKVDDEVDFTLENGEFWTAEQTNGVSTDAEAEVNKIMGENRIIAMFQGGYRGAPTLDEDVVLFTINAVAPTTPGTYEIAFEQLGNGAFCEVFNSDNNEVASAYKSIKITVKGAEPTVEETFVDTKPVDGQPAYLCVLQPVGEFTRMGIKCEGYDDTFWALADNNGTYAKTTAAVQVIGIENATFTTVIEK